jgi:hypothetical protein
MNKQAAGGNAPPRSAAERWAPAVNLIVPGGGLILLGAVASGLVGGLLLAVCANFAVLAVFIIPDDFSHTAQMLIIGLTGGTYVGLQVRLAGRLRECQAQSAANHRRRILWQSQQALESGDAAGAVAQLGPLLRAAPEDLLVAYRLAQALTAAGNEAAAQHAWQRLRQLDRHGLYKQQIQAYATLRADPAARERASI